MIRIITTALFCLIGQLIFAQPGHTIEQKKQTFGSFGELETYELLIMQANKADVIKGLVKQLEKKTKLKTVETKEMVSIDKVFYEDYWLDSLSIKAIPIQKENGTMVTFSFDNEGQSVGKTTHPELHLSIKKYLKNFGLNMYEDAVKDELKSEEKKLKTLEKELKSAMNNEDKIRKKIQNEEINKTDKKEEIAQNQASRESKVAEIQTQKDKMNAITDDKEAKAVEKATLKTMSKELKVMKKDNKKMHKTVFKIDNHIRDLELEKEGSIKEQESIKGRINNKKDEIIAVKNKLYAITEARD